MYQLLQTKDLTLSFDQFDAVGKPITIEEMNEDEKKAYNKAYEQSPEGKAKRKAWVESFRPGVYMIWLDCDPRKPRYLKIIRLTLIPGKIVCS